MRIPSSIQVLAGDFRFWVVLFFAVRMFGITNPPIEVVHNWRQSSVNMVARNFVEEDANPFYPRVDNRGERSGITGMEFPLLNYLIYLLSLPFGFESWYGRLINLLVSSIGVWFFYKLVRQYFDDRIALYSGLALLASNWFMYSRKVMPDTFSVSIVIVGLWYVTCYLRGHSNWNLLLGSALLMFGVLSKLPAALPTGILLLWLRHSGRTRIAFPILGVLMVLPAVWYFFWSPHLIEAFGTRHFFLGASLSKGFSEIVSHPGEVLEKFYFEPLRWSGFALCVFGLVWAIWKRNRTILWISGLCSLLLVVLMLKGGRQFYHHGYYIVPFVPVMALLAGFGVANMPRKWMGIVAVALLVSEGVASQWHDFHIKEKRLHWLEYEACIEPIIPAEARIAIGGSNNPTQLYWTHRKGWILNEHQLNDGQTLDSLHNLGCDYLFIDKTTWKGSELNLPYQEVLNSEKLLVYEL